MVGGLLCERTVKEVLPILVSNQEQVKFIVVFLDVKLASPGIRYLDTLEKKAKIKKKVIRR
jgi:hypothetical protein